MNIKILIRWLCKKISNYNLFISDENEEINNTSTTTIQHQRYTTRLYVLLLILFLYVIFFTVFVNPQTEIVTISDVTSSLFDQLRREHGKTLSCPCSTTIIPYKSFLLNTLSIDPICSSIFVSKQWVQSFYIPWASSFLMMDFRTTAYSQFQLLAAFCSFAERIVSQLLIDIDRQQLLSIELLSEDEVQSQVIENVKLIRTSTYVQLSSSVTFLQITAQSNSLISALNTNAHVSITAIDNETFLLSVKPTIYYRKDMPLFVFTKEIYSCNLVNSVMTSAFYTISYGPRTIYDEYWPDALINYSFNISAIVDGFLSGCTPFDGLLTSTFDCLYNTKCLEQLIEYFPNLNQTNFNLTNSRLTSNQRNDSLYERLNNLFIEDWLPTIDYGKYFTDCAPLLCTYTTTEQTSLSYTMVFLFSLYGGITIILRLIAPLLVESISIFEIHLKINCISLEYCRTWIQTFILWIKYLNLFKSSVDQDPVAIKQQFINTRVFLFLLSSTILTLLLFTSLSTQTTTMTVSNPSIDVYRNLQISHQNTSKCPCSTTIIPYQTFISLSPIFHQVCSSDFVSDAWITFLSLVNTGLYNNWATRAAHQFRLLSAICQLVDKTITDAVQRFILRSLVTFNVLTESDFNLQSNTTIEQFKQSTIINFGLLLDTVHLFLRVDQPCKLSDYLLTSLRYKVNDLYNSDVWKLILSLTGMFNTTGIFNDCICAIDPYCQSPSGLYIQNIVSNTSGVSRFNYIIPGSIDGCYALDSFFFSSLECYYSNSNCLSILAAYMNTTYITIDTEIPWFSPEPLVYNSAISRFVPNTSLSVIVKGMMIEQWNDEASFTRYYTACAPKYCTYSYTTRTYNYIGVITKMLSTIGGLIIVLRLITPHMTNFICQFFEAKSKTPRRGQTKFLNRIIISLRNLIKLLHTELINLTIFPSYSFGKINSRTRVKCLNQLATRLYILLLISGFVILSIHTLIRPEILTKTFSKPSLATYKRLLQDHSNALHCPCSVTSSTYDRFIILEPTFHQVCSSQFISDEWRMNIIANLRSNLSNYDRRDYRRFLSAHLQYLAGLCHLSKQSVNAFIQQLISSVFVTTQLLSQTVLNTQIEALIVESKSNAPIALLRLLFLHGVINQGNAIISAYGTNYNYLLPDRFGNRIVGHVLRTEGVMYDNECSCALNSSCIIPARFLELNSSTTISIKGLRMGCIPSESFFLSTLECFYDLSCINLIYKHVQYKINVSNTPDNLELLSKDTSRFLMNTSIIDLINELFIENWSITINYSLYFDQCSPNICSYTYLQQLNSLYTITRLLGLCGGLTVVLKWICPTFICLLAQLYACWKKRDKRVQAIYIIERRDSETINNPIDLIDIQYVDSSCPSMWTVIKKNSFSMQRHIVILWLSLFMLLATVITIPSVYFTQRDKNIPVSTVLLMNSTATSVQRKTSLNIPTKKQCQLTFESDIIYSSNDPISWPCFVTTGDFNRDNHLDIIVLTALDDNVGVLLNNGNGTFGERRNFSSTNANFGSYIAGADVNNDDRLDLVLINRYTNNIQVLLGIGNGSFEEPPIFSRGPSNHSASMTMGDFNGDTQLDVLSSDYSESYVGLGLGNGDGTFAEPMLILTGTARVPSSIVIGDFNADNRLDFAVIHSATGNIGLFFGYGNGTFQNQTILSIGTNSYLRSFVVADFNHDNRLDLAVIDILNRKICIFLGNSSGIFEPFMEFSSGHYNTPNSMVAADFNGDHHIDLAFVNDYTNDVGIFIGNGNGTFQTQIRFSTGDGSVPQILVAGDFDGDTRLDMAVGTLNTKNLIIFWNTCNCCISNNPDE